MKRLLISLLTLLALLSFTASDAYAQDDANFKVLIQDAFADYSAKRFDAAIEKFMQARVLKDDPDLLYNIGLCYYKKKDCIEAEKHFQSFLKRKEPTHTLYKKAENYVKEITPCETTGTLQATCTPQASGTLSLDGGTPISCGDLAGLKFEKVSAGKHTLVVSAPGHESVVKEVEIEPGKFKAESVNLKITEDRKIGVGKPVKPKEDGVNWLGWSLSGAGVLFIGAGVAIDIVNLGTQDELAALALGDPDRAALEDTYSMNQALIITMWSVGVVALGTGITFLILEIGKPGASAENETDPNAFRDDDSNVSWQIIPSVGVDGDMGGVFSLTF